MSVDIYRAHSGQSKGRFEDLDFKIAYAIVFGFYVLATPIQVAIARVRRGPNGGTERYRSILDRARAAASSCLPFTM